MDYQKIDHLKAIGLSDLNRWRNKHPLRPFGDWIVDALDEKTSPSLRRFQSPNWRIAIREIAAERGHATMFDHIVERMLWENTNLHPS